MAYEDLKTAECDRLLRILGSIRFFTMNEDQLIKVNSRYEMLSL